MPTVAVTRRIPEAGLRPLYDACEVRLWPEELPPSPQQLAELIHGCDGVLTMVTDAITPEVLDREPQLKVVSNFAVGYDNINVPAATARGVAICNTPGVLTETTADTAFALLMAAARRMPEGMDYVKAGQWRAWLPMLLLGRDIYRATIGIVGFGRIGQAMARRARGFDMTIIYYSRTRHLDAERELGAVYAPLDELLNQADFVSLHVGLSPQTRQMIGQRELELMKPSSVLINAARGGIVDTAALVAALRAGIIGGAALDVTDPEPLPGDHPLLELSNCIVVPHTGSSTVATRDRMTEMAVTNLLAVLRGERPPAIVNPEVLGQ